MTIPALLSKLTGVETIVPFSRDWIKPEFMWLPCSTSVEGKVRV